MKKIFLPFLLFRRKKFQSVPVLAPHVIKFPIARTRPFVLAFSLLLTPYCLLLLTSCKDVGIPPDRIIPDTTNHGPDTTSHDFVWTIDTLGAGGGSVLNDVAIINDTLAYAVGEIHLMDSLGQIDPQLYNVARWDGKTWSLSRATSVALGAIFAFGPIDIWAGSSAPYHWDGVAWTGYNVTGIFGGYIKKIWGKSSQNLYIVGTNGSIAHFDGNSWTKIESGTTVDFQDIWGGTNPFTSQDEIVGVASYTISVPQARVLVKIEGTSVSDITDGELPLALSTVWFVPSKKYFLGGDGLFSTGSIDSTWKEEMNIPAYYKECIRGTGLNDMVWVGGLGYVAHYNGASWHYYTGVELPFLQGNYLAVDVQPRVVIAVGVLAGGKSVLLVGRR